MSSVAYTSNNAVRYNILSSAFRTYLYCWFDAHILAGLLQN